MVQLVRFLTILAIVFIPRSLAANKPSLLKAQSLIRQAVEKHDTDPMIALGNNKESFATDPGLLNDVIRQLTEVVVTQTVEVRLLGLDGDTGSLLQISEASLLKHLKALRADMDTVALDPYPQLMPVFPEFTFKVTHASSSLLQSVNAGLEAAAAADQARPDRFPGEQVRVPHTVVEDVLHADTGRDPSAALTIYLLAPNAVADGRHSYTYGHHGDRRGTCSGCHWVGEERYMWVDIGAGPALYGPGMGYEGQVFQHTSPHPLNYKPDSLSTAIVPDLAAMVWSAVQHHVWPPLQHGQAQFTKHLSLEIIHMHDTLSPPPDKLAEIEIKQALMDALKGIQHVSVHETWIPFASCDLCVAAYTSALRVRTARDASTPVVIAHESRFLDTRALYSMLSVYKDGIYGAGGVEFNIDDHKRVLPVFVFDISDSDHALLLSDNAQAAAFPDMVVAVTSRKGEFMTHYTCSWDRMRVSTVDITRQVLAALLTSAWAVTNTSTYYTPATGPGQNYLWSVGATPYAPLSNSMLIPGPLAALLPRNLALTALNTSLARVTHVLQGFQTLSTTGHIEKSVAHEWYHGILLRTNLALFKTQQAAAALSAVDYVKALRYARSLEYDAAGLEKLAVKVSRELKSQLTCATGPGLRLFAWAPVAAMAMWPVARWLRRKIYKPKLEKMW